MKTTSSRLSRLVWPVIAAGFIGYAAYLTVCVRALERHVRQDEAALQTRLYELEHKTTVNGFVLPKTQFFGNLGNGLNAGNPGLEQRLEKIEKEMQPHVQLLSADGVSK